MGDNGDIELQLNVEDNNGAAATACTIPEIDPTREQKYYIPIKVHGVYFGFNTLLIELIVLKCAGTEKYPNTFETHPSSIIICLAALCVYFPTMMSMIIIKMKYAHFCSLVFNHIIIFTGILTPVCLVSVFFPSKPVWIYCFTCALFLIVLVHYFRIVVYNFLCVCLDGSKQVYSQVAYEIMEKKSADVKQGVFSKRNLIPRILLRTTYMLFCGFFAAMLPFFGDLNAVVGAIGFIPLDFVLPMLMYNMTYKPSRSSFIYWLNICIMVVFTCTGLLGTFSSVRQLVLDASKFKPFGSDVID